MYLLEGDEKALLIDTGYGAGNLREYVEKLTSKPISGAICGIAWDTIDGTGATICTFCTNSFCKFY